MDEFLEHLVILSGPRADSIRDQYVRSFVDTTSPRYQREIAARTRFRDGLLYTGYLWDHLKSPRIITEEDVVGNRELRDKTVYAMWDLHSEENILTFNYWKFPKDSVLSLPYDRLRGGLTFLPEDLYIFDDSFQWTLVLTHEYLDNGARYCLQSGRASDASGTGRS